MLVGEIKFKLCIVALLFGLNSFIKAQTNDSITVVNNLESENSETVLVKYHSPHKATIYSAVVPGLGQIYNKKYWKLPILYGGIAGMTYAIHFNNKYYKIYRSAYRDFVVRDPGNTSYEKVIPVGLTIEDVQGTYATWFESALENKKKYYKRYRDLCYIGMVAIYIINIIDATVDAHFYNFDISKDLSLRVEPTIMPNDDKAAGAFGLQLKVQF